MSTPAIIILVLYGLDALIVANKHGQPKGNFSMGATVLDAAVFLGLLYWGGFFR